MLRTVQDILYPVIELAYLFLLLFFLLNSEKAVQATLQDLDKSLAAGVHNPCFFQNRQHLRRLVQHLIHITNGLTEKVADLDVRVLLNQLAGLGRTSPRHCEDCTLLRLHDSLVRRLNRLLECSRRVFRCDLLLVPPYLAASAEELGQNDTRVTSRTSQGT